MGWEEEEGAGERVEAGGGEGGGSRMAGKARRGEGGRGGARRRSREEHNFVRVASREEETAGVTGAEDPTGGWSRES